MNGDSVHASSSPGSETPSHSGFIDTEEDCLEYRGSSFINLLIVFCSAWPILSPRRTDQNCRGCSSTNRPLKAPIGSRNLPARHTLYAFDALLQGRGYSEPIYPQCTAEPSAACPAETEVTSMIGRVMRAALPNIEEGCFGMETSMG